jgi:hypothetical protein
MRMLRSPTRDEPRTLDDGVGISTRLGAIVFGILLVVSGRALIGVRRCIAPVGSISARIVDHGGRWHGIDRAYVEQGRFFAAGIIGVGLHALRDAFPNLSWLYFWLSRGLRGVWREHGSRIRFRAGRRGLRC